MVTIAGVDRGLNIEAIQQMEIGQVVDYAIEWNKAHKIDDDAGHTGRKKPRRRKATQADIDAFWG